MGGGLPRARLQQDEAIGICTAADHFTSGRGGSAGGESVPAVGIRGARFAGFSRSNRSLRPRFCPGIGLLKALVDGVDQMAGLAQPHIVNRRHVENVRLPVSPIAGNDMGLHLAGLAAQLGQRITCACGRQQPIARAHDIAALQHQVLAIGNDHADEDVQRGCVCLLRPDRSWQQQADRAEPDQDAQASIAGRSGFT